MNKRYGLPYKGSKNKIANWVVDNLPKTETLIDLFFGGGAITHCAMEKGKYKNYIVNDIENTTQLFKDAVEGKFKNETRWISRKDFFNRNKDDLYIGLCWSFGNNNKDYMYAKEIEPWKKALWYARVYNDYSLLAEFGIETEDASRKWIKENENKCRNKYGAWLEKQGKDKNKISKSLESLERLQSLQSLERLQSLQSLESLESYKELKTYRTDYENVPIPDGDVLIYADIPYINTNSYQKGGFDHERFYKWLENIDKPVIVSEYTQPPHTVKIASIKKARLMNNNGSGGYAEEGLFINEHFFDWYVERMGLKKPLVWITKGSYKQAQLIF